MEAPGYAEQNRLAWLRRTGVWLAHLALGLAALYAAAVAAMYLAQTWLLFPTALAGAARVRLPASAQRLEASTPDGEVLVDVRIRAVTGKWADGRAPTLLGFGGNAWNADAVALYLHELFPGREVSGAGGQRAARGRRLHAPHRRDHPRPCSPSSACSRRADHAIGVDHVSLRRRDQRFPAQPERLARRPLRRSCSVGHMGETRA